MKRRTTASELAAAPLIALLCLLVAARAAAHPLDAVKELPSLPEYFALGIEHILLGIDHLLFLLGLLLAGGRLRDLLLGVTAFTVAHSLTLAAHVLGAITVAPTWVEPLIALSIAWVGAMNLLGRGASSRLSIAFGFGLVHGLGFAGALAEIGVPRERIASALLLFNAGVEAGQLVVVALLVPIGLRAARRFAGLGPSLASGLNACLVIAGLVWAATRVFSEPPAVASDASDAATAAVAVASTESPAREASAAASLPRSIYPSQVAADPRAAKLCSVFQELPRSKRAECNGRKPGLHLAAECTRVLSAALGSGALRFEEAQAERCVAAMQARYADCAFTEAASLRPLAECASLWQGTLAGGERCRSSLECAEDLHCRGLSPLDTGTCAAPEPEGARCGLAVDPLAAYLPHAATEHGECGDTRECARGRCRDKQSPEQRAKL